MQTEVYAIHTMGLLPDGHIGNCPIEHGPLFFSNNAFKGEAGTSRFALCRRGHVFEVDYVPGQRYGRLTRLKGVKSKYLRGW